MVTSCNFHNGLNVNQLLTTQCSFCTGGSPRRKRCSARRKCNEKAEHTFKYVSILNQLLTTQCSFCTGGSPRRKRCSARRKCNEKAEHTFKYVSILNQLLTTQCAFYVR